MNADERRLAERNKKLATIIINQKYPPREDDQFNQSYEKISEYSGDRNLALWYLAFGQTFGAKTDSMHKKMRQICENSDKALICLEKEVPIECKFRNPFGTILSDILSNKFNLNDRNTIEDRITKLFKQTERCGKANLENCEYDCPLKNWEIITKKNKFRFNRPFFYYDTLSLLKNNSIRSFEDLFIKVNRLTDDCTIKSKIIKSILASVRGIRTKTYMFLQWQNFFCKRELDDYELIFTDIRVKRIARRLPFPYVSNLNDLPSAIRKFAEENSLTANQIDDALYHNGDICRDEGCGHDAIKNNCHFFEICMWQNKSQGYQS